MEGFETEKKALDALNKNASSDARFHGETILITFTSSPNSKKLDYSIRTERSLPSKFNYESRYRFERMTPVSQLQHCLNMEFIRNKIENPTFSANVNFCFIFFSIILSLCFFICIYYSYFSTFNRFLPKKCPQLQLTRVKRQG